ncbi:MAG: MauE/DoxX family redox-associated membrane protein [Candidatus Planktophila sp.]|jgi:uncharacterized membrane protein YphA (DoxX/SURF4 family)|tara:strand:- start:8240 stop:8746 length:507 start_codon:yes stop_codon:yes gene_type:complete
MKIIHERLQPWLGLAARLILGGVLFAAGYLKVGSPDKSQMAVRAYELLPISIANLLGLVLPAIEIAIGALIVLGAVTRVVAALGGFTMFIFIIAIAQAWARGLNIDCGCFGGGGTIEPGQTQYLQEIIRDVGLVLLAWYLVRYPVTKFSIDKDPAGRAGSITEAGDVR